MTKLIDHVLYQGRMVPKHSFRAFVYNTQGEQRLAQNWTDYQQLMDSCVWFSTLDDAKIHLDAEKKPKAKKG